MEKSMENIFQSCSSHHQPGDLCESLAVLHRGFRVEEIHRKMGKPQENPRKIMKKCHNHGKIIGNLQENPQENGKTIGIPIGKWRFTQPGKLLHTVAMENDHAIHWKTDYFDWAIFKSYVTNYRKVNGHDI